MLGRQGVCRAIQVHRGHLGECQTCLHLIIHQCSKGLFQIPWVVCRHRPAKPVHRRITAACLLLRMFAVLLRLWECPHLEGSFPDHHLLCKVHLDLHPRQCLPGHPHKDLLEVTMVLLRLPVMAIHRQVPIVEASLRLLPVSQVVVSEPRHKVLQVALA